MQRIFIQSKSYTRLYLLYFRNIQFYYGGTDKYGKSSSSSTGSSLFLFASKRNN